MKRRETKHLEEALTLAATSVDSGGGPFGAVVVKDETVIGRGRNRVVPSHDPTAHAEIVAIREAAATLGTHDLSGCVIYASCEPCPMCLAAILWARVDRVVHAADREDARAAGFDDALFFEELGRPPEERRIAMERALESEGRDVLERWARHPNRAPY